MSKSNKQTLIEAKLLITDRKRWCQGDFAQDIDGDAVDALAEQAQCWCSLGALGVAAGVDPNNHSHLIKPLIDSLDSAAFDLFRQKVSPDSLDVSIVELNDGEFCIPEMTSHEAVLAAFDLAIERAPA